jgi:hypothetical protein
VRGEKIFLFFFHFHDQTIVSFSISLTYDVVCIYLTAYDIVSTLFGVTAVCNFLGLDDIWLPNISSNLQPADIE